jgi:hypothetical protein
MRALRALSLCLLLGAPAVAQEAAPTSGGDRGAENVWVTRFYEANAKKDWREATLAFNHLRENYPATMDDRRLVFLNATAHFNLKEKDHKTAVSYLETLINMQEDHIGGLYLLAQIRAASKNQPQDTELAKDLLLQSARAGQYVLRDINSKDGKKVFGKLLTDSTFILRIMNASNEFQVSVTGLRNPFISPVRAVEGPGGAAEVVRAAENDEARKKELETRIESLFSEIERLAQDRQVEELIGKFTELRQIMNEYGELGSELVKQKKEKWAARLAAFGEVQLSIQLQIYINEGNQHLRTMAEAIRDEDYDLALERFRRIQELKDQMYAEEREVFHRNAEALFLRGKALADRAARLKKISSFQLAVTGIIVAPPNSDEKDSAIINDRIYQESDPVINEGTDEEIEGLVVVEIIRSTVRFRYEDTEFVRELKNAE